MRNVVVLVSKHGNPNQRDPVVDSFIDPIGATVSNEGFRQGMAWNREGEMCVALADRDLWDIRAASYLGTCAAREGNGPALCIGINTCTLSFHSY